MIHSEFTFNLENIELYGQSWTPNEVKGIVVLVHGLGEYSSRLANSVMPKLIDNNFAVFGFDLFGHGKTKGKRGVCPSFSAILDSLDVVIVKAKGALPNIPLFLYGHSMGGGVVTNYTLQNPQKIKGSVATSPFLTLAFQPAAWKLTIGKKMTQIFPKLALKNDIDVSKISRDKEVVKAYLEDKYVHPYTDGNFSIKFIEKGEWAIENASKLKAPMFLVHGTGDQITNYKGTERFANNSDIATLKLYEGGYHELHNDLCKEEVLTDIVNWLNSQI